MTMNDAVPQSFDDNRWFDVRGNRLRLVYSAPERLKMLIELIESADKTLKICFYMFEDDSIGKLILNALVAACNRGIDVSLIIDSFGSNGASKNFFDPFRQAGGTFAIFSPRFSTSYFVRNHQKMVIADDRRALIGGFNIADQYFDRHADAKRANDNETTWADIALMIDGSETKRLSEYYASLFRWVHNENGNIRSLRRMVKNWQAGEGQFRWLLGGPSNRLSRWAWSIKKDLEKGKRLDLVTAYFSPGQGLLRRIANLSKRGGSSRLVLAGKTDNGATIGASRLLYGYLLKRNARIYEYQPKRLHCKLVIVDDATYIGSANFDLRSLFINVEMMLRIEDEKFAGHARKLVDILSTQSQTINMELHRKRRGFLNRLRWTLSYFFVNTLDYSVTRRFNFGIKK
ncbi:Cardiolipin synthase, ClsC [hydrothermal vent metagenome]|uniref:Cardiolipin synthase, ClsC n=1 Tax=hydrothermal vent metagenome TaxID=652676 RepID=A0A3B0SCF4_9ZZZZ